MDARGPVVVFCGHQSDRAQPQGVSTDPPGWISLLFSPSEKTHCRPLCGTSTSVCIRERDQLPECTGLELSAPLHCLEKWTLHFINSVNGQRQILNRVIFCTASELYLKRIVGENSGKTTTELSFLSLPDKDGGLQLLRLWQAIKKCQCVQRLTLELRYYRYLPTCDRIFIKNHKVAVFAK